MFSRLASAIHEELLKLSEATLPGQAGSGGVYLAAQAGPNEPGTPLPGPNQPGTAQSSCKAYGLAVPLLHCQSDCCSLLSVGHHIPRLLFRGLKYVNWPVRLHIQSFSLFSPSPVITVKRQRLYRSFYVTFCYIFRELLFALLNRPRTNPLSVYSTLCEEFHHQSPVPGEEMS